MPFIRESIITTMHADGGVQIAPMGVHETSKGLMLAPFKPSATLHNLLANGYAVINYTDDVRVYAGCLTQHRDWPTCPASDIPCERLQHSLAHTEIKIAQEIPDEVRPQFICEVVSEYNHAPFHGFNRAQFAVIELAILVSRLNRLSREKIESEIAYLDIGFSKCAGEREQEAWQWLMERVQQHYQEQDATNKT